ncbi:DMT family transporter [Persicimonas caeni]|nr:DMT family transporter [Persicimonas caeni]
MKFPSAGPTVQMFLGATLISTSAVWVRVADVGPTVAGFYRMLFGAIALAVIAVVRGWPMWRDTRYLLRFLPIGAFFALDLFLWHRSIHFVGPGLATVLANLQVFVLAGAGVLFMGERLGWRFPLGLGLALPGLLLLVGVDVAELPADYQLGVAFGVGTAFAYSAFLLGMRRAQQNEDTLPPGVNVMSASVWVALFLAAAALVEGQTFAIPNASTAGSLVIYGVMCQGLGWFLMTRSMPVLPASIVGLILLLQPALAMVWDILFFDKPFGPLDLVGGTLVLAGIYLASRRNRREARG